MSFSLRKKTILLIIIIAFVLSGAALLCNITVIRAMVNDHYRNHSEEISATMASVVDPGKVTVLAESVRNTYYDNKSLLKEDLDEYLNKFSYIKNYPEFDYVRNQLRLIQDKNDVNCIYISILIPEDKRTVYVCDGAYEDACEPGIVDPLFEINYALLMDPSIGFPAYVTDTPEYGWLVTSGTPVYDGKDIVAYAMVDISMTDVMGVQTRYVIFSFSVLFIVTVILCYFAVFYVYRVLVRPIKALTDAADSYSVEDIRTGLHKFSSVDIRTGDELEQLLNAMKQMENDLNIYFSNMLEAKEELRNTREEVENMNRLANVDALTGVRNKRAYDKEAKRLEESIGKADAQFALVMVDMNFLKNINDNYGHEKGNVAIRKLCSIICKSFSHSPVFRIGGDEFVVIVEKEQFDKRDELISGLREKLEKNYHDDSAEPWERISAAIGYAEFTEDTDRTVDDVFKKADNAMYENKKKMKEQLAHP
ncbi:diguanylate cyclase (GGDEF) domain-containing protein [Lachnospiraceae bacterium JC7]|nr:diguanylate cyclase (GGDEF) domain-containing protein [Lachnospiraceae bacterium JC7]